MAPARAHWPASPGPALRVCPPSRLPAVPSSGGLLNIPDAYAHPLFTGEIDRQTAFRTRSLLCAAIEDAAGKNVAVVQVRVHKHAPAVDASPCWQLRLLLALLDFEFAAAPAPRCAQALNKRGGGAFTAADEAHMALFSAQLGSTLQKARFHEEAM